MINEQLYTSNGAAALRDYTADPSLFDVYHQGYREQVEKWPTNPLDGIIAWLRARPKLRVADFGCGEARLARSVPNSVHSFDLVARPADANGKGEVVAWRRFGVAAPTSAGASGCREAAAQLLV